MRILLSIAGAMAMALGTATTPATAASTTQTKVAGADAIVSRTLDNGLKIVVWPDHDIPNAAYYTFYRVGSRNEYPGITGLAHYFERSLNARSVGALKPDPVLFHKVIEGTDLEPQQVVYVGDDPALDVVGARAAGMCPVWINREQAPWPEEHGPQPYTVRTLHELGAALGMDMGLGM